MKKNFSILKWIIFPILVLAFGSGIIYVSCKIFGAAGSVPSILLVCVCLAISLIFILHTSNHRIKSAMIAAFTFECLGITALGITLICSIVILRQFAGATETIKSETEAALKVGDQKTEQLKIIAGMKSGTAQRNAIKVLKEDSPQESSDKLTLATVYDRAESFLLYPLIGEASVYLLGLLIVFGLVQFEEAKESSEENNEDFQPVAIPRNTSRMTFTANNAPLRVSSAHTVDSGNGHFLSLSQSGTGVAIRYRKTGEQAQHVLRIPQTTCDKSDLYKKNYRDLAVWTLAELKRLGKDSKPIYAEIEKSL